MTLGSDISSALPFLRGQAESRMTESVDFFTVETVDDPVTLQPVEVETIVGSSVGRVRSAARDARDVEVAGQEPVVSKQTLSVPVGSVKVGPSVNVRVTASSSDSGLVGSVYRTRDFPAMGQVTAWRYEIEQVS